MTTGRYRSVLVVDDNADYRDDLVSRLRGPVGDVVPAASSQEALSLLRVDARRFQFAVIDQQLPGTDGIALTRELLALNRDLFVLVFTNVPSDDPESIARFRFEAMAAGAFRYLERGKDAPIQVMEFLDEMEQLIRLRERVSRYYTGREKMPSLLPELDIGVDIIDQAYKVWFMNDALRRIVGMQAYVLPAAPCASWHGYTSFPCHGCLVETVFHTGQPIDRYFLSPLPRRDNRRLFFMRVWTRPVTDECEKVLKAKNGGPLAVIESVQDLTGSAQLREMPLQQRLQIIAESLRNRPKERCYRPVRRFDRVRIMTCDPADLRRDRFSLRAAAGFDPPLATDAWVTVPRDYLAVAEENIRESDYGYYYIVNAQTGTPPPSLPNTDFILWPIQEGKATVALLEVSGPGCSRDAVEALRLYAEEIRAAITDDQTARGGIGAEGEAELGMIDFLLQNVSTPEDAMVMLVEAGYRLTGSLGGHLRYVQEGEAVLLQLARGAHSEYERIAPVRHPLSKFSSWSVRAILSGQEQLVSGELLYESRRGVPNNVRDVLDKVNAICIEPLLFDNRAIGSFCLQASDPNNFTEHRRLLAQAISRRIALALHDYLVEQRAERRVRLIQEETIDMVLHNIHTPVGNMRFNLANLRRALGDRSSKDQAVLRELDGLQRQTDRIATIREEYLRLRQPWQSRPQATDLHVFLTDEINAIATSHPQIRFVPELEPTLRLVEIDRAAIEACLRVLLRNACDALQSRQTGRIGVVLRPAEEAENKFLKGQESGLAIDVQDDGGGVPEEVRAGLFKIIKSTKPDGLGFGLTYCLHVASSAQGGVYCHEQPTEGACFTLVLPYRHRTEGVQT